MKKTIWNIICTLAVVCITVLILNYLTDLMERKSSDEKYHDFFQEEQDIDVLFMGTSHMMDGVFPMELYNDYGIVSYNFGNPSSQLATTYWVMENALDYTTPKLVVIDCFLLANRTKSSDVYSFVHYALDAFPMTTTKIKAIWDLSDDPILDMAEASKEQSRNTGEKRTKIGLLWDYSVYHSRWNELTEGDFNPYYSTEKGAIAKVGVNPGTPPKMNATDKMTEGETVGVQYLRKMIEDCQKRGIQVLLTYLPFTANGSKQMEAKRAAAIAQEYNIGYINFLELDVVNYKTDFFDENSHVNVSGARKITDYIGRYIREHYSVPDRRDEKTYEGWNQDYKEYVDFKIDTLTTEKELDNYLMLLAHDSLNAVIEINNTDIFKSELYKQLFGNLGVNVSELGANTDFIIIRDGGAKTQVLNSAKTQSQTYESSVGNIKIEIGNSGGSYSLSVDGVIWSSGRTDATEGLKISVSKSGTEEYTFVEKVSFQYAFSKNSGLIVQKVSRRSEQ